MDLDGISRWPSYAGAALCVVFGGFMCVWWSFFISGVWGERYVESQLLVFNCVPFFSDKCYN